MPMLPPIKDAVVVVNSVDLSAYVKSVSIETETDEVDQTAMGSENKVTSRGLNDASITVTFFQALGASLVDATLDPLSKTDTPFLVKVKAKSDAISTDNPEWTMTSLLFGYAPLNAEIGEASMTDVTFKNASQNGIRRYTSAGTYT